jgi:hypothetical protein
MSSCAWYRNQACSGQADTSPPDPTVILGAQDTTCWIISTSLCRILEASFEFIDDRVESCDADGMRTYRLNAFELIVRPNVTHGKVDLMASRPCCKPSDWSYSMTMVPESPLQLQGYHARLRRALSNCPVDRLHARRPIHSLAMIAAHVAVSEVYWTQCAILQRRLEYEEMDDLYDRELGIRGYDDCFERETPVLITRSAPQIAQLVERSLEYTIHHLASADSNCMQIFGYVLAHTAYHAGEADQWIRTLSA